MKLITDFKIEKMKGKVVKSAIEYLGKICVIFDDDSYFVVQYNDYSHGDVELLEPAYQLGHHEMNSLGIITNDEYNNIEDARLKLLSNNAEIERKAMYEELKKEFG
jgi:hypothetical protein